MKLIQLSELDLDSIWNNAPGFNYLIDLSPLKLISVTGDDAFSFLQAQFSNDLSLLDNKNCQLHAYCNPKGRTLAVIRIVRNNSGFWLIVPENISEALINRLKMYVLRAKVQIVPETDFLHFGVLGEKLQPDFEVFQYNVDTAIPGSIVIANSEDTTTHFKANSTIICHSSLWRWLDIKSGIPQVYANTAESFIPQTINLDLVDGISFRKGCFPGQEIVARLKYLGKPKQRLIVAEVESTNDIKPGDEIFTLEKPDQKSGQVVDAVNIGDHQFQISAMVPATMVESGDLRLGSVDGPGLRRNKMPYEIL